MKVEIWSDVVCLWCYIGKRRFEAALARFEHPDQVDVVWRAFELDPVAPREREGDLLEHLARKYGMSRAQASAAQAHLTRVAADERIEFRLDRARPGNTFDAHRLLHLAAARGVQDAVKERLFSAYLNEGAPIGDADTLAGLAAEAGLDAEEARRVLSGDEHADAVREDERMARRLQVSGVPFFVVDGRYGVAGAQPSDVLLSALDQAWAESRPSLAIVGVARGAAGATQDGPSAPICSDDTCAV